MRVLYSTRVVVFLLCTVARDLYVSACTRTCSLGYSLVLPRGACFGRLSLVVGRIGLWVRTFACGWTNFRVCACAGACLHVFASIYCTYMQSFLVSGSVG